MARLSVYILACTISYTAGYLGSLEPPPSPTPPRVAPEFVAAPFGIKQTINAYPVDIKLRIINAVEFRKSTPVAALMSTQQMTGVGAYTLLRANPCEIVMPDDFQIEVIASKGEAVFNSDTGDTLAHEILHCLYGSWHQPWNKIASQSKVAQSGESVSPPWTKRITSGPTMLPPQVKLPTWSTR